jgi:NADPH-dependent ferric siderophore reductase
VRVYPFEPTISRRVGYIPNEDPPAVYVDVQDQVVSIYVYTTSSLDVQGVHLREKLCVREGVSFFFTWQ